MSHPPFVSGESVPNGDSGHGGREDCGEGRRQAQTRPDGHPAGQTPRGEEQSGQRRNALHDQARRKNNLCYQGIKQQKSCRFGKTPLFIVFRYALNKRVCGFTLSLIFLCVI